MPTPLTTTISPKQPFLRAEFNAGTTAGLTAICAADASEVTIESFVRGVMSGDSIDDTADRVAAVQQRCRTLNYFNSINRQDIDWFGVIARLETQSTNSISILQHKYSVTIKAANNRPRCAGSKTSF